jgi:hypothetical protein
MASGAGHCPYLWRQASLRSSARAFRERRRPLVLVAYGFILASNRKRTERKDGILSAFVGG